MKSKKVLHFQVISSKRGKGYNNDFWRRIQFSVEANVLKTVIKGFKKSTKKPKIIKPEKARLTWTQKDTCSFLESLVVMVAEQFNPNDTNEWLAEDNIELLKTYLIERKVNKNWWTNSSGETDMTKCRKKYTNLKANFVAQQMTKKILQVVVQ